MGNNQKSSPGSHHSAISERIAEKYVDNLAQELQIRAQEVELRKQNDKNNFDWAMKSLEVQQQVLLAQAGSSKSLATYKYMFITGITIIICVFVITALILNKDQIIMELLKIVLSFITGAAGGSAYTYMRVNKSKDDIDKDLGRSN